MNGRTGREGGREGGRKEGREGREGQVKMAASSLDHDVGRRREDVKI